MIRIRTLRFGALFASLAALVLLASLAAPAAQAAGIWTATGNMINGHTGHATALLNDGRVLVAEQAHRLFQRGCGDLFDPATDAWTATGIQHERCGRTQKLDTTLRGRFSNQERGSPCPGNAEASLPISKRRWYLN